MKNNAAKITLFLMACSLIINVSAYRSNNSTGSSVFGGMAAGAVIGGFAGGSGKAAGYGALAGGLVGMSVDAANQNRQYRDRDDYDRYNRNRGYNPNSRSSMRDYIAQLEQDNQNLRDENYDLIQQLNGNQQYNRYHYGHNRNMEYNPHSRSSMRDYIPRLEQRNQNLRDENYDLMRQLNASRR